LRKKSEILAQIELLDNIVSDSLDEIASLKAMIQEGGFVDEPHSTSQTLSRLPLLHCQEERLPRYQEETITGLAMQTLFIPVYDLDFLEEKRKSDR
jgi:hypothetical protein